MIWDSFKMWDSDLTFPQPYEHDRDMRISRLMKVDSLVKKGVVLDKDNFLDVVKQRRTFARKQSLGPTVNVVVWQWKKK
jgi:hypothetical protein